MHTQHYTFTYTDLQLAHAEDLVRAWHTNFYCLLYDDLEDHYIVMAQLTDAQALQLMLI